MVKEVSDNEVASIIDTLESDDGGCWLDFANKNQSGPVAAVELAHAAVVTEPKPGW